MKRRLRHSALLVVMAASLAACGEDQAENVDEVMSNTSDTLEQNRDEAGDAMGESGYDSLMNSDKAVEEACEQVKEGIEGEHSDC